MRRGDEWENGDRTIRWLVLVQRALESDVADALSVASGAAQLLDTSTARDSVQEQQLLAMIERNLRRADRVMGDLELLGPAAPPRPEDSLRSIQTVMHAVVSEARASLTGRGTTVQIREPLPEARVDATRLSCILRTLIAHARPSPTIHEPTPHIQLLARLDHRNVVCMVLVSGDRQAEALIEQAEGAAGHDTHLVLGSLHEMLDEVGGALHHESRSGIGTTFYITLPCARSVDHKE